MTKKNWNTSKLLHKNPAFYVPKTTFVFLINMRFLLKTNSPENFCENFFYFFRLEKGKKIVTWIFCYHFKASFFSNQWMKHVGVAVFAHNFKLCFDSLWIFYQSFFSNEINELVEPLRALISSQNKGKNDDAFAKFCVFIKIRISFLSFFINVS